MPNRPFRFPLAKLFSAGVMTAVVSVVAGCSADAYRRSADADIYRLLSDRKIQALGYDPQAVSPPAKDLSNAGSTPAPAGSGADEPFARSTPGESPRDAAQRNEAPGTPGRRAYAPIPLTPIPPMATPALDLPPPPDPNIPLGPYQGEQAIDKARIDPFAAEMASKWAENRYIFGPFPARPKPLQLDLFGALRYAVKHSRAYKTRMDDLYLAALDVTLERHLLSPRPTVGAGLRYTGGQKQEDYRSALTATMNAGVRQKLPYGGEIVAEALVGFVNSLNGNVSEGESAAIALSGTIPLLRGAGMINLEGLISAERELIYEVRGFEDFRRVFATDIADAYFDLQATYQSVSNRRQNVTNSISLLERTRAIYAANLGVGGTGRALRLTFLEVQRSEQQLLDAQNSLITAQQAYLNQLDDFKLLIGMDTRLELDIIPVALDITVPDLEARDPVEVATRFRLDLQTQRDRIDDARRGVANAQNGLLPDLSLFARGEINNLDGDAARNIDSRTLAYSAGLTLDLPIDRLPERNVFRQAMIIFHQRQRLYDDLNDRVAADVRSAVRAIRSSEVSVAIQKRSIELAERRLENANLLLKRGDTNARDVVEAQSALIRAQDSYERARADLQIQVLLFLRQTGTLRVDPDSGTMGKALDRSREGNTPETVPLNAPNGQSGALPQARQIGVNNAASGG